eukprot:364166-Chlamydomonas_euryale.AAC.9
MTTSAHSKASPGRAMRIGPRLRDAYIGLAPETGYADFGVRGPPQWGCIKLDQPLSFELRASPCLQHRCNPPPKA